MKREDFIAKCVEEFEANTACPNSRKLGSLELCWGSGELSLLLCGNLIAKVFAFGSTAVLICNGGFPTATTQRTLNQFLGCLGSTARVKRKAGNLWVGEQKLGRTLMLAQEHPVIWIYRSMT